MPKFEVTLREIEIYFIEEIDADSEEDAVEKAYELISDEKGRQTYHDDSDSEPEACEVEPL